MLIPFFRTFSLLALFIFAGLSPALASHLIGGQVYYRYLGANRYEFTLIIYEDCYQGQPEAIQQDAPAYLGVFKAGSTIAMDTSIQVLTTEIIPVYLYDHCNEAPTAQSCLMKKTFLDTFTLPASPDSYVVAYQRCCRSAALENVSLAGSTGMTYFCTVPSSAMVTGNSSAVFRNLPPYIACLNHAMVYDHSATDPDGDSLSYELAAAYTGGDPNNVKPLPVAPPYSSVQYMSPFFAGMPLASSTGIEIDPVTGMLTGRPSLSGRYLMCVRCNEWRGGVKINSVQLEYQLLVTPCAPTTSSIAVNAGDDTTILVGNDAFLHFTTSAPVTSFTWSPAIYLNDSSLANPTAHFTDAGAFTYVLHAVTDSGCDGYDTVHINVLSSLNTNVPSAFTPNGDGKNDVFLPLPAGQHGAVKRFKVFDRRGVLLYDGTSAWDGSYQGDRQDMDTYYWELQYVDSKGNTVWKKGAVTLVR